MQPKTKPLPHLQADIDPDHDAKTREHESLPTTATTTTTNVSISAARTRDHEREETLSEILSAVDVDDTPTSTPHPSSAAATTLCGKKRSRANAQSTDDSDATATTTSISSNENAPILQAKRRKTAPSSSAASTVPAAAPSSSSTSSDDPKSLFESFKNAHTATMNFATRLGQSLAARELAFANVAKQDEDRMKQQLKQQYERLVLLQQKLQQKSKAVAKLETTLDGSQETAKRWESKWRALQTENEALKADGLRLTELLETQTSLAEQHAKENATQTSLANLGMRIAEQRAKENFATLQHEHEALNKKLELSEVESKECKAKMEKMEAQMADTEAQKTEAQAYKTEMRRKIREMVNEMDREQNEYCDDNVSMASNTDEKQKEEKEESELDPAKLAKDMIDQYGAAVTEKDRLKKRNKDLQRKSVKVKDEKNALEIKLLNASQCVDFFQSMLYDVRDQRVNDEDGGGGVNERLVQFDEVWIPVKYLPAELPDNGDVDDSDES